MDANQELLFDYGSLYWTKAQAVNAETERQDRRHDSRHARASKSASALVEPKAVGTRAEGTSPYPRSSTSKSTSRRDTSDTGTSDGKRRGTANWFLRCMYDLLIRFSTDSDGIWRQEERVLSSATAG